jgi:methionine-rich copper-binding protein CopC
MTPTNQDREAARERARLAREARAGRTRTIRKRVIWGAAALFVTAWLFIALMLVTGHDPVLSKQTASASSSNSTPASVSSTASSGSSDGVSGAESSSSSQSSSSQSTAPLTTRSS